MNIICIIQEKQQIIKRKLKLKYFKETNNADFLHIIHGHDISFYFFAILKSLRFSRYLVSSSIISKNFKPSYLIHSVPLKTVFIEGIWKCHTAWKMSKVSVFSCIRTRKIFVFGHFSRNVIFVKADKNLHLRQKFIFVVPTLLPLIILNISISSCQHFDSE